MHFKTDVTSLMSHVVKSLDEITTSKEDHELYIITAAGMFVGTLLKYDDKGETIIPEDNSSLLIMSEALKRHPDNNKKFIILLDVWFYPNSNLNGSKVTMPFAVVFTDEIICEFIGYLKPED